MLKELLKNHIQRIKENYQKNATTSHNIQKLTQYILRAKFKNQNLKILRRKNRRKSQLDKIQKAQATKKIYKQIGKQIS